MSITTTVPLPGSVRVFKTGSTYVAQTYDGKILSTSTTDASVPINAAINNIPDAAARGYGGTVFIHAGVYDCKTTILHDITTTTYHGVTIMGEGLATRLNFTPSGALTDGINLKALGDRVCNLRVYGNSNVVHLITATGKGSGFTRHDYGSIDHVRFDGANASADGGAPAPVAGQVGFFINGPLATLAEFFWKIHDCDFRALDVGVYAFDQYSTSTSQNNLTFFHCTTAVKISSGQHNLSNLWIQGDTSYGQYGIHFLAEGTGTGHTSNLSNIQVELHKTATLCAGVLIDPAAAGNIRITNCRNAFSDPDYWFTVIDKSTTFTNLDLERAINPAPSKSNVRMGWFTGIEPPTAGQGMFSGNMADIGSSNSVHAASGIVRRFTTGATINTMSGRIFTSNALQRIDNLEFTAKIFNVHITDVRVFVGFIGIFAGASIVSTADMLNARNGVGLWCDTAVSTDWKVMHNDGSGASTVAPLSTPTAIDASNHRKVKIIAKDSINKFTVQFENVSTDVTTNIPATATALGWLISIENTTGADRQLFCYFAEEKSDR